MRAHMKERSLDFRVIKNTLAQKAAKNTPFEVMEGDFKGPTSLLISFDDVVAPAKALADYAKSGAEKNPEVICGLVEGKQVSPEQIKALSELPSKLWPVSLRARSRCIPIRSMRPTRCRRKKR